MITYRPKDVAIDQHGEAVFVCGAEGNPPPLIFWSLEGNRTLVFPGEKHGKFKAGASKNGQTTLTVQVNMIFSNVSRPTIYRRQGNRSWRTLECFFDIKTYLPTCSFYSM